MKKVLSLLVAFVFLQVQSWALSGGPQYGAINNSVSGTWSGTLIGNIGTSGLGLFEIGIPTAGLGSGTFAFYVGGGAFFGSVVALADGEKNTMSGVMKGSLKATVFVPVSSGANGTTLTLQTIDVALMGGQFIAKILGNSSGTTSIGVGARLTGTAAVTVSGTGNFYTVVPPGLKTGDSTLTLDGFEQSGQVTGQVSLSSLTGTTPASGG
jgi:hypothetical protein